MRDVSHWEQIGRNTGSREGYWLRDLEDRPSRSALVKLPKRFSTHTCGEVWAEYIAMSIGRELELRVPEVEIVRFRNEVAALIANFVEPGYSLQEGSMITNSSRSLERLSLSEVHGAFEDYLDADSAKQYLIHMVCFDILIGNPDRHQDNWGVVVSDTSGATSRPAPYYDNGSALGSNLDPHRMIEVVKGGWAVFDNRFRYEIVVSGNRRAYIQELLTELRGMDSALADFDERLSQLTDEAVHRIVQSIPDTVISNEQRTFARKLLVHRRDLILNTRE